MNTNELIERLAHDLAPVTPLWRPGKRAAIWLFGAAIYLVTLALSVSGRGTLSGAPDPGLLLTQLAAIVASYFATRAAFASVVPGSAQTFVGWLAITALVWLALLIGVAPWQTQPATILAARHEWWCVGLIFLGGTPLLAALVLMLRRGAALTPMATAAFAAIAVGALANVAACLWRPHANADIALFWHGGAVLALVAASAWSVRFTLRRKRWHRAMSAGSVGAHG
jgi:hypothetical protein